MFEEDMMVVYWKWLWLYCFCSSDCFMSFDCITNASFTAGECYVYWNVLQTGFWDQERLCVLRHKLAYCIATMRTWVVIRVYWPFQGPSPGMHCHILLWWYSSAWVLLKKKTSISDFMLSLSPKMAAFSQFCVPAVTELFMFLFPSQFLDSIGPDKGSFHRIFFFLCWQHSTRHVKKAVFSHPDFCQCWPWKWMFHFSLSNGPD